MPIENFKNKVHNIINLPSLPSLAMEIISLVDNPDTSVSTLSEIISKDPVFAARILKVANSPFYSYPKAISTIDFAITVLGFETVKEILVSIAFTSHFKKYQIKYFDINKFWLHSIMTSFVSRELAKEINYKIKGEAFLAGLIHDMGIFIMCHFFNNEYKSVLDLLDTGKFDLVSAEKDIFGASHSEVGSWLFEKWNFPPQLVETTKNHHSPDIMSINPQLAAIVYYSEYIIKKYNLNPFAIENSFNYSDEFLPIITFEDFSSLDDFFEKNKEHLKKEEEKINTFLD